MKKHLALLFLISISMSSWAEQNFYSGVNIVERSNNKDGYKLTDVLYALGLKASVSKTNSVVFQIADSQVGSEPVAIQNIDLGGVVLFRQDLGKLGHAKPFASAGLSSNMLNKASCNTVSTLSSFSSSLVSSYHAQRNCAPETPLTSGYIVEAGLNFNMNNHQALSLKLSTHRSELTGKVNMLSIGTSF